MKRTKSLVFFIVAAAIVSIVSTGTCFGFTDEGFQYWSVVSVSSKLSQDWKVDFEQDFRLGDEGGNLYYEHSDVGFVYTGLGDWIDLGFNYRLIYEKDSADARQPENRPHLNVTFKGKMFGLDVSDRSRLEFRDRKDREDIWRYRNKIAAKFPWELTELKLKPYVANEFFLDFDADDFNKNRFYAGASYKVAENLKLDIYYMWQATKTSREWLDINVLGTKLKFSF